jgi:hypothetical protein
MKKIVMVIIGFFLMGLNLYAADGDFIVDGKLGVGTTGPQRLTEWQAAQPIIRLSGNAAVDDDVGIVEFHNRATGGGAVGAYLTGYRSGANNSIGFNFVTLDAGTNIRPMVILPGGNVGIGTTSPSVPLHIGTDNSNSAPTVSDIRSKAYFRTGGDGQYAGNVFFGSAAGANFFWQQSGKWDAAGYAGRGSNVLLPDYASYSINPLGGNVGIGTTNPGSYKLYVNGSLWYQSGGLQGSDERWKKNISGVKNALEKVINLHGVTYEWKKEEYQDKGFDNGRHYGVLAQEVEKVLPEAVKEDPNGYKGVAYNELIPILIEAIKEQQKMIEDQQKEIQTLKTQQAMVSALYEKVNAMEKQMKLQGTVALTNY